MHLIRNPRQLFAPLVATLFLAAAPAFAANDARNPEQGLLWRVEKKGAPACHLFGTMHHDDERVTQVAPPVQRAFDAAKTFAVEMINDGESTRSYQRAMVRKAPLLSELVGEADWPRYDTLLAHHGLPANARAHLKPWAALLILVRPAEPPGIILDHLLLNDARNRGKDVVALESVDEQIAAMNDLPDDTQLALLRHAEANYDRIQESFRPLVQTYLARDLRGMWQLNESVMAGDDALAEHNRRFLDSLLFQRNRRFADRLAPLIDRGNCFAAFGALHLYGKRGVPALLAARGYKVMRVY